MADSILALTFITVGVATLLTCEQQLHRQQERYDTKLAAARLAKESSDQMLATRRPATIQRGNLHAVAAPGRITVWHGFQMVVQLRK